MSENNSGYIYIGQYYHHHGKDLSNLTEKKIGKSVNVPNRESALNSTKFTIGYTMIKYWAVDDMDKIEKAIHSILPNRLNGEWFEDDDDTLIERLSKFMSVMGGIEKTIDADNLEPAAKKLINTAKDRSRIAELAGQQFSYTKEGITVTIEVTPNGTFKNIKNNQEFDSPSAPFAREWAGQIKGANTINGWTSPKNLQGRSIDQELEFLQ